MLVRHVQLSEDFQINSECLYFVSLFTGLLLFTEYRERVLLDCVVHGPISVLDHMFHELPVL